MHLYWFLLVVSALASDSLPDREIPTGRAVAASFGIMLGWALLARLAVRSASRQVEIEGFSGSFTSMLLGKQMDALRWLGLLFSGLVLGGFGLAGVINRIPFSEHSITLRAVVLLTPGLSATMWSWYCEFRFDQTVFPILKQVSWWRHLVKMFRLQGAWLLAPVLVLMLLIDATQIVFDVGPAAGAMLSGGLAMLALPLLLPFILRRIWKLEPIDQKQQETWFQSILQAVSVRGTHVLRWNTEGAFCTAMVAGFLPGFRQLLLSDELLIRLNSPQISMVVLHELAHIRRHHLLLRLFVLAPVWGVALVVSQVLAEYPFADAVGIVTGLGLSLVVLRIIAYRTEFDADSMAVKMAVEMAGQVENVPATERQASIALADALLLVTDDHPGARKATWMHPSIDDRCRALLQPYELDQHTCGTFVFAPHSAKRG